MFTECQSITVHAIQKILSLLLLYFNGVFLRKINVCHLRAATLFVLCVLHMKV